ncbi:uncharacterized protein L201_002299 [Kwoniella dendrophila CBS 6074]|uniref:Uncharacterized protein n=1 Tax=Kwoniella dendrophila CBS 6074 TaxID=1295534 RepID=A0AAX4JSB9_9TREE
MSATTSYNDTSSQMTFASNLSVGDSRDSRFDRGIWQIRNKGTRGVKQASSIPDSVSLRNLKVERWSNEVPGGKENIYRIEGYDEKKEDWYKCELNEDEMRSYISKNANSINSSLNSNSVIGGNQPQCQFFQDVLGGKYGLNEAEDAPPKVWHTRKDAADIYSYNNGSNSEGNSTNSAYSDYSDDIIRSMASSIVVPPMHSGHSATDYSNSSGSNYYSSRYCGGGGSSFSAQSSILSY